ncbi:MAG: PIN domain-containing protein [Polyangiaceae bacterium]|jgi:predicted nucleic acid-binding protein|nr:PIN domain-containing protein [Polyangiaceae bacterium]
MSRPTVLMDCNVLLDFFLLRPGRPDAEAMWDGHVDHKIDIHLTATTLVTLEYVINKTRRADGDSEEEARDQALYAVKSCLQAFKVLPVGWYELDRAKNKTGNDFEDNVQIACAERAGMDWIVTNDSKGFTYSTIPAIPTATFVSRELPRLQGQRNPRLLWR